MATQLTRELKALKISQTGERDILIADVSDLYYKIFGDTQLFLEYKDVNLVITASEINFIDGVAVTSFTQARLIAYLANIGSINISMLFEDAASIGLSDNTQLILKSGRNPTITSGSVPEDMFNGSTTYVGFPTGTPEEIQVFSSNAGDTGTLTFTYLASTTATAYTTATVTLNGTTPVNTGITAYRVHTANYNSGSATAFNLGAITIRWRTTTTVVFIVIPIGTSQSYAAVYTIPFGSTGLIKRIFCNINDSASVSVQGALWIRGNGMSPRLRRNFSCSTGSAYNDTIYGGLTLPALTDVTMRIISSTSNSATVVVGGFDMLVYKNA